ncbi:hypothetical protein PLICRDRAFT_57764 [Plicaturopsis crispa FD-325 SS-3]|uniref:Isochorismatase-like domain-containing protein n=1 Tax=Plicaturopsis crispa FD-325 SS-3 TaxID=944288 RepID=A0A0C9T858_PLICR|nr:hypothetical protein PLICRDRAFT_57764 [Plicaturopsis crispa FD-325 SS-3]
MSHDLPHPRILLLIDVQAGMLAEPPVGIPSSHATRTNIARVLHSARVATPAPQIIHVRNTGAPSP